MGKGKVVDSGSKSFRRVNLKLPVSLHASLRALCRKEGVTLQRKMTLLVREFLQQHRT